MGQRQQSFLAAAGLVPPQARHEEHPSVILDKLESLALHFAYDLMTGRSDGVFKMVNRTYDNVVQDEQTGALLFGEKKTIRKFNHRTASSVSRMFQVLVAVQRLLLCGRRISQRELFYMLVSSFDSQAQLNRMILDVSALLGAPRYALNIGAATRGVIAGKICVALSGSPYKIDCEFVGPNGWPIPGDVFTTMSVVFASSASYILVIEKYGIFMRLVQDRIYDRLPCILVCGKGYPSVATRAMTSLLASRLRIPVLGLADFNPHGACLLQCYRHGSARSGVEGQQFMCDLRWLGLRSPHVSKHSYIGSNGETLTERDVAIIRGLQRNHKVFCENVHYANELKAMKQIGKYELQWLYGHPSGTDFLQDFILDAILHGDYI
ncbi:unnamed protein product [Agarophyton chilense]